MVGAKAKGKKGSFSVTASGTCDSTTADFKMFSTRFSCDLAGFSAGFCPIKSLSKLTEGFSTGCACSVGSDFIFKPKPAMMASSVNTFVASVGSGFDILTEGLRPRVLALFPVGRPALGTSGCGRETGLVLVLTLVLLPVEMMDWTGKTGGFSGIVTSFSAVKTTSSVPFFSLAS